MSKLNAPGGTKSCRPCRCILAKKKKTKRKKKKKETKKKRKEKEDNVNAQVTGIDPKPTTYQANDVLLNSVLTVYFIIYLTRN